jgi:hypothetical protein
MTETETDTPPSPVESRIVYVRAIDVAEVPDAARMGATALYAIHDANGARLAVVADRDLAFAVARQNELTPVSAH